MSNAFSEKLLCVDDEDNMLHLFRRTLGREFQLYVANSAESALQLLQEHRDFAVIVSDYNMPGINGVEFLKLARTLSPDAVLVMLTGNIELDIAIKTINETDIFRYMPKPCPMEVMRKVVLDAIAQYRLIISKQELSAELEHKNAALLNANRQLAKQNYLLETELEMAKIVYANVYKFGHTELSGLDFFLAAKDEVGGDFLLNHVSENSKSCYLMLGDLTGHGLQSALAVLLVTEVFGALCDTEPSLDALTQNINEKMCRKLPVGLFCSALILKIDLAAGQLFVWQGGMPDAYFLDANGEVIKTLASNNLPLGIDPDPAFGNNTSCHAFSDGTSLFVYSDGVTEQIGLDETMFGEKRLRHALRHTPPGCRRIDTVLASLRGHQNELEQTDDISLFELNLQRLCQALEHP
ncbi:MAG: hypothetical protein BVN35_05390 [Proteobacteria bacterium ST_bin11]|jgi:serine phosphatase RsbU (regulator of sigma subunit)|nr:MAG: hypothetical protein BVN35_05390 [Proteobacteria bacterium ST_bin11]